MPVTQLFRIPWINVLDIVLKLSDIVQKVWAPLRKLFAPPAVLSWLRACTKRVFENFGG